MVTASESRGHSEMAAPLEIVDPEPNVWLAFSASSAHAAFRCVNRARTAVGV